ncbi:MAG: hypothetical protein ACREDR_07175, partial [Blastocatellia bacterium]
MTTPTLMDIPIKNYLSHFRRYYPGILEWYSDIKSEIGTGRRSLFVSQNGPEIEGLAIIKNGVRAK